MDQFAQAAQVDSDPEVWCATRNSCIVSGRLVGFAGSTQVEYQSGRSGTLSAWACVLHGRNCRAIMTLPRFPFR